MGQIEDYNLDNIVWVIGDPFRLVPVPQVSKVIRPRRKVVELVSR